MRVQLADGLLRFLSHILKYFADWKIERVLFALLSKGFANSPVLLLLSE
jgi:hypothetical protein